MPNTKIIAFYLPQFHAIPENDKWWGKGFTEWTNTRKAEPLFRGHNQPRTPLNERYYDLTNVDDLKWQMEIARDHGLDGFCYYHYWFNGKLLLEKPLELMRNLPERIPYFFCWANETWKRTWDGSQQVLIEQQFGGEEEWNKHFQYLLGFFEDDKYIKIDNKPVLALYGTQKIEECEKRISFYNKKCIEHGFDGIYVIEEKTSFQKEIVCANSSAYLEFEPMFTITFGRNVFYKAYDKVSAALFNFVHQSNNLIFNYDLMWHHILKRKHEVIKGKDICLGAYVDWDNTARKNKNSTIIKGATPKKFGRYLLRQLAIANTISSPFLFINAWNEWGEGTYLEPDCVHKYEYLHEIQNIRERLK